MSSALVRGATVEDAEGIASVHMQSWRDTYSPLLPRGALDGISVERSAERWARTIAETLFDVWIAEREGRVVGYAAAGGAGADAPRDLQLSGLYIEVAEYGSGTGQALLDAAIGVRPAFLWVAAENPRAHAFYRRNGFLDDGARDQHELLGHSLAAVRLVR